MMKQQKGMTLLGLVFTIIVMLALAAVTIAMLLDEFSYDPEPVKLETNNQVVLNTDNANEITPTPDLTV